jgi:hypothetical protein
MIKDEHKGIGIAVMRYDNGRVEGRYLITAMLTPFYSSFIIPHYSYAHTLLLILYHTSLQLCIRPSTHPLSYLITAMPGMIKDE